MINICRQCFFTFEIINPGNLVATRQNLFDYVMRVVLPQAVHMITTDGFHGLTSCMALMLLVWLAKPPFTAKAGPAAAGH